jgi:hypothetical protein
MFGYDRRGKLIWKKRMPSVADYEKADRVVSEFGQVAKDNHPKLLGGSSGNIVQRAVRRRITKRV